MKPENESGQLPSQAPQRPYFELSRVYDDGDTEVAEITEVAGTQLLGTLSRRGFFGAVLTCGLALASLTGEAEASSLSSKKKKCKKKKGYKWDKSKKKCKKKKSGSSSSYCSCNLVCTCDLVYR